MSLLDLLAKVIGPTRAVSVYIFLRTKGLAILAGLAFLAILGVLLARSDPDRLEHVAYITGAVQGTTPINNDVRNGVIVDLQLPDGEILRLTETEGLISGTIDDTACVEKRRHTKSGQAQYRLRLPHRCDN